MEFILEILAILYTFLITHWWQPILTFGFWLFRTRNLPEVLVLSDEENKT